MKFIKENLRVVIAVAIAIILIITGVIFISLDNDSEQEKPNKEQPQEENLKEITGMSKEDAIELVKPNFVSDNYEFSAVATADGFYKVIVKNTVEETEIIYYVDPTNETFYIDMGV